MHRRLFTPLILAALVLAACGGNSAPALTDPTEILTKAVAAMQEAKSVHFEASVEGTFKADLTGVGQASEMSLTGTSFSGDLDIANENAHLSAAVPAFLGLTADIIIVGSDTYTKISLTGDKYEKGTTTPGDPTDPAVALKEVADFLAKPEVRPTKKDDATCGSRQCYQVEITLSADDLKVLMPEEDLQGASIVATILIEKDTLHPVSVTLTVSGAEIGEITLKLTMSDWDKSVTISAPPADQVK